MEVESALSSYRIFNAVAEAGNLSKAAKELFISQPAISKAVSKLEQSLSVKLFTRNSRGVKLTEEGALLYEYTCSAFESLRQGEATIRKIHTLGIGHIKLGVSTTLCKHLLLPYLQNFISAYPHIKATVECHPAEDTLALLEAGKLDIGLIEKPPQSKGLSFLPVRSIRDTFVASPSYLENLKKREPSVNGDFKALLSQATLILLDAKNSARPHWDDYLRQYNLPSEQILEADNIDLLIEFSKVGLGVGCVIREFVEHELADGSLIELTPRHSLMKRTVGFAYSKTSAQSDSVQHFIDYYKGES